MGKQDVLQLREMIAFANRESGAVSHVRPEQLTRADLRAAFAGSPRLHKEIRRWLGLLADGRYLSPAKVGELGATPDDDEAGKPSIIETVQRELRVAFGRYAGRAAQLTGKGTAPKVEPRAVQATYLRAMDYLLGSKSRLERLGTCGYKKCENWFYTDDLRQKFCCTAHQNARNQSKHRAKGAV